MKPGSSNEGVIVMPLFEFSCIKCENEFEKLMLGSTPKPPVCPECSSPEVTRLMSAASFKSNGKMASNSGHSCSSCSTSNCSSCSCH